MINLICPNCNNELKNIQIDYITIDTDYFTLKDGKLQYTHSDCGEDEDDKKRYICLKCKKEITDKNIIEELEELVVA